MQEIWVIKNKETRELWVARSGKKAWNKSGAAKGAWANTNCFYGSDIPKFDDQDEYFLVQIADLTDWKKKYEELVKHIESIDARREEVHKNFFNGYENLTRYEDTTYGWDYCLGEVIEGITEE